MKKKIFTLSILIVFVSSCVVKSLQPFYLAQYVSYDASLEGKWKDQKNNSWEILSFKKEWESDKNDKVNFTKEDLKAYDKYKKAYIIKHKVEDRTADFIGVAFDVDGYTFIDLTPFEYQTNAINSLAAQHLLKTHSVALIEKQENGEIIVKWVSDEVVRVLFKEGKLRLAHEMTGVDEDLVLTASSEELYEFLRKFIKTDSENKWESDDTYTLKAVDA